MIFFNNTLSEQLRIEKAIEKYGYVPEHNFWWYQYQQEKKSKNVFVEFEDGMGLLTIEEKDIKKCSVFVSPIAPLQSRVYIILKYLDYVFQSKDIEKVTFELEDELYKKLINALPDNLKARRINYSFTWPIYNITKFESSLPGKHWKTLRKTKNNFYQNHSVIVSDAKEYKDKKALHFIIDEWKNKRGRNDKAHVALYHNFIDENFKGATEARVLIIDGKACGINVGWMIPNSNRFYGALGIHDYSVPGLGDILYLEDLMWLKVHGYKEANMGGGEAALTNFKNKFQPESSYKTRIFSIVKK